MPDDQQHQRRQDKKDAVHGQGLDGKGVGSVRR